MELNKKYIFEDFVGDIDEISINESEENVNSIPEKKSDALEVKNILRK